MNKIITLFVCLCCALFATKAEEIHVQSNHYNIENRDVLNPTDANIFGHVVEKSTGEHMPGIAIVLKGTMIGTSTDDSGHYMLKNLPEGKFTIEVSFIGFKTITKEIKTKKGQTLELNFELEEDLISLDGVVVSANRNETKRRMAPTLVKVLSPELFENTNSNTLAQGLVFQPGVRVENDCQNCGFSQVRINGLEGKYTQILIDSRPIFSSLAGVYGLEQIPANMIERVEVIRGGGSALFGASAIAGTINIITKEPIRNSGNFTHTLTNFDGSGTYENNTTMNLSWVSSNNKMGAYIFGQNRYRSAWDQNGDGFSELPKLKNQTIGMNTYYKTSAYSKLSLEYHHMEEFRRGGSGQDLPPHIAEDPELNGTGQDGLVEQIKHSINTGSIKFNVFSPNQKHNFNTYVSAQDIQRDSYYSAYGKTSDITAVVGAQYIYNFDKCLFMPADLTGGIEFNHDDMKDKAIDSDKYRDMALEENPSATGQELQDLIAKYTPLPLHQVINVWSAYAQNEWKNKKWSFLIGGRIDKNSIMDHVIFSPRANVRFNPTEDINLRFSYAEGFRAPQAFDEDLHISNVGGERVMIKHDSNLKEERSRSVNGSIDWYTRFGNNFQINLLLEGFFTKLNDPFILSAPIATEQGYMIKKRTNGPGSKVYGSTLEGKLAWSNKFQLQAGITIQRSIYDKPIEWSADEDHLSAEERLSDKILKTPNLYGYFTASYTPIKPLSFSINGNYTGEMYVPHLFSEVNGTADQLVKSPDFFELGAKVSYDFKLTTGITLQLNAGIQNIFNSYQDDFDLGASRDSGYVFGPGSPRTYYSSVKVSF